MPRRPPPKTSALYKLGDAIKTARFAAGMTQKQLAKVVGCSTPLAEAWEQGLRDPGIDNLLRIARACRVSLMKLVMPLEGHDPGPFPARARKAETQREAPVRNERKADATLH